MKQVKVKNLKGNEITALPIVTDSGTVLIHADVVLNSELINRIRNLGIQSLSIKEYPDEIIDPGEYGHIIIGTDDKLGEDDDIYSDNSNGTGIDNDNNYNKEIENVSEDGISNTDNNGGESDYYQDKSNNKNDSDNVNNDSHNAENLHDNELNKSDIDSNESNSKAKSHSGNSYYRHIYKVEETTNNSRKVVKNVLEKHIYKHNQDLKILGLEAERIIESVLSEPEVINNITEIRNLSTDMYTHCINVCSLSTIMALRLKMSDKQVKNVSMGAMLHDIGLRYIKTPYMNTNETYMNTKDAIEYKKHTIFGYSSVQDEDWIPDIAKEIILLHHERIDGKGYPFSHKGDKLKMEVKLVSLCDDFDSLISGVGNPKLKIYEAIEYIKANQGLKYDATIAEKLLETVAVYPVGIKVITSEGETGIVVRQNKKFTDRPVIKMLKHSDGSLYEDEVEKDLMEYLTLFIVTVLASALYILFIYADVQLAMVKYGNIRNMREMADQILEIMAGTNISDIIIGIAAVVLGIWINIILTVSFAYLAITLSATILANKKGKGWLAFGLFVVIRVVTAIVSSHIPTFDFGDSFAQMIAGSWLVYLFEILFVIGTYIGVSELLKRKVSL